MTFVALRERPMRGFGRLSRSQQGRYLSDPFKGCGDLSIGPLAYCCQIVTREGDERCKATERRLGLNIGRK